MQLKKILKAQNHLSYHELNAIFMYQSKYRDKYLKRKRGRKVINPILSFLIVLSILYIIGLTFTLLLVATGYMGGDLMTEHYRSVLQLIFK